MNPFNPGYFTEKELSSAGFKKIGSKVMIAKTCTIIGLENIEIASNVRIDGYCTITAPKGGFINIGSYNHIAAYCQLVGGGGILLNDFVGISSHSRIYSANDDYSGGHLTGPTVPEKYTSVARGKVIIGAHTVVGSGSTVFPGVTIGEGCSIGAMSLVNKSLDPWGIYAGIPAKFRKARSKNLLKLEEELRAATAV